MAGMSLKAKFCIVVPVFVSLVCMTVWSILSAVISFANLEWESATSSPWGRVAFALTMVWLTPSMIKTVIDVYRRYSSREGVV